jgi:pimeloyl-ACP methyl ester carboxylesterase
LTIAVGDQHLDAVIDQPDPETRNGWVVLLIGGGYGNDLNWSVPGKMSVNGQETQLTISGQPHEDAPRISQALCERGFTVMRWSTIHNADPLKDKWPVEATPRTLLQLLELSREALATLRKEDQIDDEQVILLGHSLGAARACTLAAQGGANGLILLAPAYFSREAASGRQGIEKHGMAYGDELLSSTPIPTLAVYGDLDQSRVVNREHAEKAAATMNCLQVRHFEDIGHQLGAEDGVKCGPIEDRVLQCIVEWAEALASSSSKAASPK